MVDAEWVAAHLDHPDVRVIEVDVSSAAYDRGHIPGAVLWDAYKDLRHPDFTPINKAEFEAVLARSGLTPDTTIVFYGYAPLLGYWLMDRHGHERMHVMEGSRERWDNRINHLLRFTRAGRRVRPTAATLCWMLPLPRAHPVSIWDATPEPVLRALILQSRRRGPVLDPFCGAGTVGRVALGLGREWIGVERDPRMAELTARRLGMTRARD